MNILKEITNRFSILKDFYDFIRIIETKNFTVIKNTDSEIDTSNLHCLNDSKRCSDCLAQKAFLTQTTLQKIELIDNKAYLHTLSPFSINDTTYVVEFFKDISNTLFFSESTTSTPIGKFLTSLTEMANKDSLTKAYNRNFLNSNFRDKFNNTSSLPISLIMIDLDHFKNINDEFGHLIGDTILQKFSSLVFTFLDSHSYFCRFGGEEFLIFLDNAPLNKAVSLANTIKSALDSRPFIVDNFEIWLSCSMGITSSFYSSTSLDTLLEYADKNLYIAKESGRNTIIF